MDYTKEKERWHGMMVENILENLKKENMMVKENFIGEMGKFLKDNIQRVESKDLESYFKMIKKYSMVIGIRGR